MIVDEWSAVAGSHYVGMTVMVPDDQLDVYCRDEILKISERSTPERVRRVFELVRSMPFEAKDKENLLLNLRNRMWAPRNEETRPEGRVSP